MFCPGGARPPLHDDRVQLTITARRLGASRSARCLPIAASTYHDPVAKRADPGEAGLDLRPQIERVFAENFEVYGAGKVWR